MSRRNLISCALGINKQIKSQRSVGNLTRDGLRGRGMGMQRQGNWHVEWVREGGGEVGWIGSRARPFAYQCYTYIRMYVCSWILLVYRAQSIKLL